MGSPPNSKRPKLYDLHQELCAHLKEQGRLGELIPFQKWQAIVVSSGDLGSTRQAVADVTWLMEQLGLIRHEKRRGIIVLDAEPTSAPA